MIDTQTPQTGSSSSTSQINSVYLQSAVDAAAAANNTAAKWNYYTQQSNAGGPSNDMYYRSLPPQYQTQPSSAAHNFHSWLFDNNATAAGACVTANGSYGNSRANTNLYYPNLIHGLGGTGATSASTTPPQQFDLSLPPPTSNSSPYLIAANSSLPSLMNAYYNSSHQTGTYPITPPKDIKSETKLDPISPINNTSSNMKKQKTHDDENKRASDGHMEESNDARTVADEVDLSSRKMMDEEDDEEEEENQSSSEDMTNSSHRNTTATDTSASLSPNNRYMSEWNSSDLYHHHLNRGNGMANGYPMPNQFNDMMSGGVQNMSDKFKWANGKSSNGFSVNSSKSNKQNKGLAVPGNTQRVFFVRV